MKRAPEVLGKGEMRDAVAVEMSNLATRDLE
jgi:hypothetical protein